MKREENYEYEIFGITEDIFLISKCEEENKKRTSIYSILESV